MSVIVSQILPWGTEALKLDRAERWKPIGPLIRPTITATDIGKSSLVLIDTSRAKESSFATIAIIDAGSFTDATFTENGLLACVVKDLDEEIEVDQVMAITEEAGAVVGMGKLVVLQIGQKRSALPVREGIILVTVEKEVEFRHLLALLAVGDSTGLNFTKLVSHFLENSRSTEERIHPEKTGDHPCVVHASGKAPLERATNVFERDIKQLLDAAKRSNAGQSTFSIHYADINGLSQLERHIIAHELAKISNSLGMLYHITSSTINTNDHSPRGWAVSICAVPITDLEPLKQPSNSLLRASMSSSASLVASQPTRIVFKDDIVCQSLTQGCSALIAAEPVVTEYDTIVGDGDCGLTLKSGAEKVLSFIEGKDLSRLPQVLAALVDDLEVTMGGTSGALYYIFLSSLSQALQTAESIPEALQQALNHLLNFTRARKGDRTCLDTLIPFIEVLRETGDSKMALDAAKKGNDETKNLQARLGRSTYLDDSATRGVPDPGAYGLLVLLEGLVGT